MTHLKDKKIILAVTGSIAAFKSVLIARMLIKKGATVKVIMTPSATEFVSPLTFSTLTGNPTYVDMFKDGEWNNHVEMGVWADLFLIAPLSANTLAKMAHGLCDNIVTAVYLSAKCPVFFAPAMDLDMWAHPSTQKNVSLLTQYGNHYIPVGDGVLASGLSGSGRLAEPTDIIEYIETFFKKSLSLTGKKIMVTAGPTYEPLDPVRFIGNHSSGKMGYSIVEELLKRGASVYLISGPSKLPLPISEKLHTTHVTTGVEMYHASQSIYSQVDVAIFAAAVADYTPVDVSETKIKKGNDDNITLTLKKNPDIAKEIGKLKQHQIHIGFALETNNEIENAVKKVHSKNLDCIVLNSMNDPGAGFNHDTNKVSFIFKDNAVENFPLMSKTKVAEAIVNQLEKLLHV